MIDWEEDKNLRPTVRRALNYFIAAQLDTRFSLALASRQYLFEMTNCDDIFFGLMISEANEKC